MKLLKELSLPSKFKYKVSQNLKDASDKGWYIYPRDSKEPQSGPFTRDEANKRVQKLNNGTLKEDKITNPLLKKMIKAADLGHVVDGRKWKPGEYAAYLEKLAKEKKV